MFPHTVTIFNIIGDKFYKQVVNDVFYHSEIIISQEGNGEKYQNAHRLILSNEAIKKYVEKRDFKPNTDTFTLKVNDLVVKGEIDEIEDIADVQKAGYDYFLIKTISTNDDYGLEELRNIEVTD